MKAEVKASWLKALRSGEYLQAREELVGTAYGPRDPETQTREALGKGYCCLGVLAQIVDPEQKTWSAAHSGYFGGDPSGAYAEDQCQLIGCVLPVETLASKNDSGESFAQIADWIEVNIPVTNKEAL